MEMIFKYPRTRHLEGSRKQQGDQDLKAVPFKEISGRYLVLEEKIDGANCGISFGADGRMYLQSRGHFLNGGYGERQFDLLKSWAAMYQDSLREILGSRYVMYGEWMYAKHTVFYDMLPHYFMEFDIFDKEKVFFNGAKAGDSVRSPLCPLGPGAGSGLLPESGGDYQMDRTQSFYLRSSPAES